MFIKSLFVGSFCVLANATPTKRWWDQCIGANYFQTNGFEGNQLVASYILPDGTLEAGSAVWTQGNGSAGINDPKGYENHPDPLYGSGAVVVSNCQAFAVNAGSNTITVFDIDPKDPGRPTFNCVLPSHGEFPVSVAASPDGKKLCVVNGGAKNTFSCYQASEKGWTHMSSWDRELGLNLTTPPHGPVGGGPSQIAFNSDGTTLIVAVKGQLPHDLNNPTGKLQPGFLATYSIKEGVLAEEAVKTPVGVPFSIAEDKTDKDVYFMADVTTGYAAVRAPFDNLTTVEQGIIPLEQAACWAVQAERTKSYYVVDAVGRSNITEVTLDTTSLNGTILSSHSLGTNSSGTDISTISGEEHDWLYVNAVAYESVHVYKIWGQGKFELVQRYNVKDMSPDVVPTKGFVVGLSVQFLEAIVDELGTGYFP